MMAFLSNSHQQTVRLGSGPSPAGISTSNIREIGQILSAERDWPRGILSNFLWVQICEESG